MQPCVLGGPVATVDRAPPAWMESAACRGRTVLFFPPHGEQLGARERREAAAREVCLSCPVLDGYRRWAREHREYSFGEEKPRRSERRPAAAWPSPLAGKFVPCGGGGTKRSWRVTPVGGWGREGRRWLRTSGSPWSRGWDPLGTGGEDRAARPCLRSR